jgi:hypothetical protein
MLPPLGFSVTVIVSAVQWAYSVVVTVGSLPVSVFFVPPVLASYQPSKV